MHVIAKAGLGVLILAALVPASNALIGAGGCAIANRDASLQQLRTVPVPRIPQLKLPDRKTETQVLVHISGYGVVMSTKIVKSSGSPFVDMHAMTSAHFSTYAGKIVNCQPVLSDVTITVPYDPNARQATPFPVRSWPPTPVPSGEPARPIQIIQSAALPLPAHIAQPSMERTLALEIPSANYGSYGIASAGGILYFNIVDSAQGLAYNQSHPVVAADLATGKTLWRMQSGLVAGANQRGVVVSIAPPESEMRDYLRDVNAHLRTHESPKNLLTELDRRSGHQLFVLPGITMSGAIDGVAFTQDGRVYSASSVSTGKLLWVSNGGASEPGFEPPITRHDVLLQLGSDSGAITENSLYAFDLQTGHAKWSMLSNQKPLGFAGNVVYIDSTWFPVRNDSYLPMTIAAVDLATGKKRNEYDYRPDPIANATEDYRQAPMTAFVSGGYAYVTVNNKWYRYIAERKPAQADPVQLGALLVDAAFDNGQLLVHDNLGAYIADSLPNSIALHRFAEGDLHSKIVEREDGTRYAVFGNRLYAFDQNASVRSVGSVNCTWVFSIIAWSGRVAVLCGSAGQNATELLFHDQAEHIASLHVTPQTPPPYRLQIREFQVPGSNPDGRTGQWGVGPMAPLTNGGIAIALVNNMKNSVMYVSPGGTLRRMPIAPEIPLPTPNLNPTPYPTGSAVPHFEWPPRQPAPTQMVAGKRDTLWFNDTWRPNIISLSPAGRLTTKTVGSGARFNAALIDLAATPDGEVWYARSLPTPQIGRADGSLKFEIPAQFGKPTAFLAGGDKSLWFFSATALVHVTPSGHFVSIPVPSQLTELRTGPPVVTTGSKGTIWAAQHETIYHVGSSGILGKYTLPDATLQAGAMATGCDGLLYVTAAYEGVLFRLRPNGIFEKYQLPFFVTNLMRAPDCTLWFVQGTNYPVTSVGTFKLLPR